MLASAEGEESRSIHQTPPIRLTRARLDVTNRRMEDQPFDSLIPYDEIVQEALRAVVGRVLREVEVIGLPGNHHFYITFKTRAPGVTIPDHLIARFPDEMTIVLQNRYWDLKVHPDRFEVGLSFNQISSLLSIPFAAITAFVDPAVEFSLQFHVEPVPEEPAIHEPAENDPEDDATSSNVVTVDFGKKK
jgi:hypothetical protein